MTDLQTAPAIPPVVRTIAYFTTLVVGALATAATTLAVTVWPAHAETVAAIAGAVTGVIATVCGGLGVAYRPAAAQRTLSGDQ
jgi:hypothetical protein